MLTLQTSLRAAPDLLATELDGETIILEPTGRYYSLNAVGTEVWAQLQAPQRVEHLRDAVLSRYDVAPGRCERDLLALLEALRRAGLVEVHGEASA